MNATKEGAVETMWSYLTAEKRVSFDGVRLHTCSYKRSVMAWIKYNEYCGELGLNVPLDRGNKNGIAADRGQANYNWYL